MIAMWGIILISLCLSVFGEKPNVEPEHLDMLRETGQHEEFARLLGLEDVSLVHPLEGRTEEDLMFTSVSPLGDILLTPKQEEQARQGINFMLHTDSKWPNNAIPYVIGKNEFTRRQASGIKSSFESLSNGQQNLEMVPYTGEKDYVYVINGRGCYSYLGKTGGQQVLSLQSNGCLRSGTIMHEALHASGLIHEQSRSDRDQYVDVLFENIPEEWQSQYQKVDDTSYVNLGPYDPYSVMHYPMRSSNGKPAFKFLDPSVNTRRVGQRVGPTVIDKQKADALYS